MSSQTPALGVYQPTIRRKPKRFKKDGTPYKPRKGWGPYRSAPNERAVEFNLQLDVQTLQQEVQNMTALRDILQATVLQQRHSPEGSLLHLVKEYLQDQREFMFSIVDPEIDVGNDCRGPEYMMYQMDMYSTLIRWIRITMRSYDIIQAEDSIVVRATSTLRFQVVRATIERIFPHITEGKFSKFEGDMDFVGAFASIVKDPAVVEMLFRHALIADNCQLGMIDEPELSELEIEDKPVKPLGEPPLASTNSSSQAPLIPLRQDFQKSCLQVVENYYVAFANGYLADNSTRCALQRDFLLHRFVQPTAHGNMTTSKNIEDRWRSLSECFAVLGFHQKAMASVEYHQHVGVCAISSSARYTLRITPATVVSVFPHLLAYPQLCDALVGEVLAVPSQICFAIEVDSGRICRIEERVDFATAVSKIVPNRQELQFMLSKAKLALDDVSYRSEVVRPTSSTDQGAEWSRSPHTATNSSKVAPITRTMHIADIPT
ncbi:hypothetical protein PHYSODRAFT_330393 [Phytophthora sojae]|uniref:Uncharacterized protein n=1 Tax=Phytophthora sojae (strain P6497) TaxID=1094619 RepID=G4Z9K1_PHYSP|nr:hypothetical protein PHYSODRAFT_330393 [Phytophthora sojae]EGZ22633.1 hypothetical protein PHYSODRAFT_330393 [Phytophthora sojae]|eukprot:XP_009525350.1 hypothetical protein PHYSODRAFT_330393 [Phytophthora sojae]